MRSPDDATAPDPPTAFAGRLPPPQWTFTIRQRARPPHRYDQAACDTLMGHPIRVVVRDVPLAGTITAATVEDDGDLLVLTATVTTGGPC